MNFGSNILIKIVSLLLLVLMLQNEIYSQDNSTVVIGSLDIEKIKTYDLNYNEIKGSPFLEKNMLTGHIVLIDHKRSKELSINYDVYTNEFFFVDENDQELVLDLKLIRKIVLKGKDEDYLFRRINPKTPHKFYDILYESETLDIYKNLKINLNEGKNNGVIKVDPKFSRDDNYYVIEKGKEPETIKLKKKNIFKLFNKEEQKIMDSILKSQKIKLKKSKDFKKLFAVMQG